MSLAPPLVVAKTTIVDSSGHYQPFPQWIKLSPKTQINFHQDHWEKND